jgi:hypothetical protein
MAFLAPIASALEGELAALLGGSGIGAAIGRGVLGGIGAVAASQLLLALEHDLSGSNGANARAVARRVPQFAIVDLHSNKTVRFLSTRKVYSILTHPSRRGARGPRRHTIAVLSGDERVVSVK